MKLVNCTVGEKSQTWCQKILLPVLGLRTQLFSMVRLEEFAPRLRREDWGRVCGPVCCRRCLPTPSSACADSDVTPSFLVTLSGFPHQAVPPHMGGPVSDTRRRECLLFTWSPSFGKPTFACFCYQLPMSVSLCLDLPRKHEGWSIMAGQYFYSRLISVDTIHIFSPVTQ